MKKISMRVISLLTVLCMLFLSGCQGQGVKAETPEEFWARPHEWKSDQLIAGNANEYGYYFVDSYSIFKYLDYKTKQAVALCNKVGCKHEDYTCEAFIEGFPPYIFFLEEKMCLITDDENGMHIYRCDLDATNREDKILLMKDEMEKGNAVAVNGVLINGNDLYYDAVYQEPIEEAGGEKKPTIKAVRHVNLKTWTEEEVCRSVENTYYTISADADGILIYAKPNPLAHTTVDLESESEGQGILLTREEKSKLPVETFYWNKKTGVKLSLYQSNYADTSYVLFAKGNCLYRLGHPEGASSPGVMGLEKMNMLTGEAEWLWNENAGAGCSIVDYIGRNHKLYLSIVDYNTNRNFDEIYTVDDFQKVRLNFLKELDSVLFEDEHGYIVYDNLGHKDDGSNGDIVDIIFVPIEQADKENPEYTLLYSYGRD